MGALVFCRAEQLYQSPVLTWAPSPVLEIYGMQLPQVLGPWESETDPSEQGRDDVIPEGAPCGFGAVWMNAGWQLREGMKVRAGFCFVGPISARCPAGLGIALFQADSQAKERQGCEWREGRINTI